MDDGKQGGGMTTPNRTSDIVDLIAAENDPSQRAVLIVLNSINTSLQASAGLIKDVSVKLEGHLVRYDDRTLADDALLNKGKGVWHVVAWVLGVAQAIAVVMFVQVRADLAEIHKLSVASQITDTAQQARITALEGKK
jgi:hypothetical protein